MEKRMKSLTAAGCFAPTWTTFQISLFIFEGSFWLKHGEQQSSINIISFSNTR